MPAAIAVPLISAAVTGGGMAAGAAIQSHQAGKAAKLQTASNDKALEYAKQKDAQDRADAQVAERANYAQTVRNANIIAPAQAARIGASTKLAHLLGIEPVDIPPMPAPPVYSNTMSSLTGSSKPVTLRSPTGQVRSFPAEQAQKYLQAGAQVVQ